MVTRHAIDPPRPAQRVHALALLPRCGGGFFAGRGDAPILILDEATSALDTKAERAVQAGLDELMKNRTTIMIAHRLSTIADVDTIITLRDGRIDEIGSPAELATSGGIYSELLKLTASSSAADRERLKAFGFHDGAEEEQD